jgi:co-chaperonin GroES (HSP10)
MKKLILLTLLMVGMTVLAQEKNRKQHGNKMEQFTPEQQNQLMLKKLTLELDLSDSQQKDMGGIIVDMNAKREAHKTAMMAMKDKQVKPTNDERFAMKIKMLDEQIAMQKRMQKVLNPKQFEKWTALKEDHQKNRKENKGGPRGRHPQNQERRG